MLCLNLFRTEYNAKLQNKNDKNKFEMKSLMEGYKKNNNYKVYLVMSCYILTIDVIGKINGDGMIQNANINE